GGPPRAVCDRRRGGPGGLVARALGVHRREGGGDEKTGQEHADRDAGDESGDEWEHQATPLLVVGAEARPCAPFRTSPSGTAGDATPAPSTTAPAPRTEEDGLSERRWTRVLAHLLHTSSPPRRTKIRAGVWQRGQTAGPRVTLTAPSSRVGPATGRRCGQRRGRR